MSGYDIRDVWHEKGAVHVNSRHWDGIDRPDYVTFAEMDAADARRVAANLLKAADEAEAYCKAEAKRELAEKRKRLNALKSEVATLEKQITA